MTFSATLPRTIRLSPVRPRVARTMRSAGRRRAASRMAVVASPTGARTSPSAPKRWSVLWSASWAPSDLVDELRRRDDRRGAEGSAPADGGAGEDVDAVEERDPGAATPRLVDGGGHRGDGGVREVGGGEELARLLVGAGHQHRAVGVAHHPCGDAAEQQPVEPGGAPAGHDRQRGLHLVGGADDGRGGRAALDDDAEGVASLARGPGLGAGEQGDALLDGPDRLLLAARALAHVLPGCLRKQRVVAEEVGHDVTDDELAPGGARSLVPLAIASSAASLRSVATRTFEPRTILGTSIRGKSHAPAALSREHGAPRPGSGVVLPSRTQTPGDRAGP